MSQAELIREGQILARKRERLQSISDAKTSLQSLINEAVHAQGFAVSEMNAEALKSHMRKFTEARDNVLRLDAEIKELEY